MAGMALYFNGMIGNKVSFLYLRPLGPFRGSGAAVTDRSAAERRIMLINGLMNPSAVEMRGTARRENAASEAETNADSPSFDQIHSDKQADQTFSELKEKLIEEHRLTPDNIKKEDDWREMDEEQWDKLIGHIDQYIDDFKEKLKHMEEVRKEAAMKAMAEAPAAMRAAAASKAMLHAMSGGLAGGEPDGDVSELEKLSWTYELETDDQVVLATAKMANEFAPDMLSKSQEIALTGDTSVGISETENLKECASVTEDANQKVWTITAFGQDGIICKQCTMDGESKELWRIDYKNAGDAEKVWKFLEQFDKDADLKFVGSKEFWEDFLAGNISGDEWRE